MEGAGGVKVLGGTLMIVGNDGGGGGGGVGYGEIGLLEKNGKWDENAWWYRS